MSGADELMAAQCRAVGSLDHMCAMRASHERLPVPLPKCFVTTCKGRATLEPIFNLASHHKCGGF